MCERQVWNLRKHALCNSSNKLLVFHLTVLNLPPSLRIQVELDSILDREGTTDVKENQSVEDRCDKSRTEHGDKVQKNLNGWILQRDLTRSAICPIHRTRLEVDE